MEELNVTSMMLNRSSDYKALDSDETLRLVTIICNNKEGKGEAIARLVNSHTKWLYSMVKCFRNLGEIDDFFQAANEGFIIGLNTITLKQLHDAVKAKGMDYSCALLYVIKGYVWNAVNQHVAELSNFELTDYRLKQIRKVRSALDELSSFYSFDYESDDIIEEVARRTQLSVKQVQTALSYSEMNVSLSTPLFHDDEEDRDICYEDAFSSEDKYEFEQEELSSLIEEGFKYLTPMQQKIISMYCGFDGDKPKSKADIANELGVSRPTVYNNLEKACEILREGPWDLDAYYYGA